MTKIEQLESELHQKNKELIDLLNAQHILHEQFVSTVNTLRELEKALAIVNISTKYSNEYTYRLEQENKNLKLSCTEWMKRSIQLQFEALSAQSTKKTGN